MALSNLLKLAALAMGGKSTAQRNKNFNVDQETANAEAGGKEVNTTDYYQKPRFRDKLLGNNADELNQQFTTAQRIGQLNNELALKSLPQKLAMEGDAKRGLMDYEMTTAVNQAKELNRMEQEAKNLDLAKTGRSLNLLGQWGQQDGQIPYRAGYLPQEQNEEIARQYQLQNGSFASQGLTAGPLAAQAAASGSLLNMALDKQKMGAMNDPRSTTAFNNSYIAGLEAPVIANARNLGQETSPGITRIQPPYMNIDGYKAVGPTTSEVDTTPMIDLGNGVKIPGDKSTIRTTTPGSLTPILSPETIQARLDQMRKDKQSAAPVSPVKKQKGLMTLPENVSTAQASGQTIENKINRFSELQNMPKAPSRTVFGTPPITSEEFWLNLMKTLAPKGSNANP